jgi:hypothetical protein
MTWFETGAFAPIDCANAGGRDLTAAELVGIQVRRKGAVMRFLEEATGRRRPMRR